MSMICLGLLATVGVAAGTAGPDLSASTVQGLRTAIRRYETEQRIPGMTVAIWHAGRIVYSEGFGLADLENDVKATTDTEYRTASMGKTITAAAIMQLAEQGRLDLHADIRKYCDFPAKRWPITTEELLSHTSGIRHYGGPNGQAESFSTFHYKTIEDSTRPFRDDPISFEPGSEFLYSTYGYVVAGLVLEGVVKQPYLAYMKHFFQRYGMDHTRDDDPGAVIPHRAAGYIIENGSLQNATHVDMSNRMPAGGFLTTAPDLARFAGLLAEGRIVKPETLRLMMTPTRLKDGSTCNYGLGLSLWPDVSDPAKVIVGAHGGSSPGAAGMLYIEPRERLAVVFLTNLENAIEKRFETASALRDLVLKRA